MIPDEINLLAEICDDPDDTDSDYGRGFAAGVAAGRKQAADAIRNDETCGDRCACAIRAACIAEGAADRTEGDVT